MTVSPKILASFCAAAALLSGCASATTTPYARPATTLPGTFAQAPAAAAAQPTPGGDWWKRFSDPALDALVGQALSRNNSLAQSAISVQRAQVQVGLSVINPTIQGNLSATESGPVNGNGPWLRGYSGNLQLSYEADLFGRLAATKDVLRFEANATAEDYQTARLSLIATTVDLYYQLAYLNERLALAHDSVAYTQRTLELAQALKSAGSASLLDVSEAEQSLKSQQSNLEDLERQRVAALNSIDLLLDGQHWTPAEEPAGTGEAGIPAVAVGVPAELLARRPDLRAAELRLREQLRQVDVTRLNFYPRLQLTGQLGSTSTELANFLKNPVGTLGADVLLPFLQVNEMQLQNKDAKLAYKSAVIGFRQTLYQALVDVENALADRRHYAEETRLLTTSLEDARRVESLDETLYRAGSTTLKVWLDAQETRRQTEASLALSQLNERLAQVTLYKALGGDA
jgi:NodT family efflux transporter outer membrane factor (OMF) lipoprotein